MKPNEQTESYQPPFGLAGLASLGCLAVIFLATKPFVIDSFWIEFLFYTVVPISVVFVILYRSSWHLELERFTRILSMMISACILFVCVLLFGGVILTALFVVVNRFTAVHY